MQEEYEISLTSPEQREVGSADIQEDHDDVQMSNDSYREEEQIEKKEEAKVQSSPYQHLCIVGEDYRFCCRAECQEREKIILDQEAEIKLLKAQVEGFLLKLMEKKGKIALLKM